MGKHDKYILSSGTHYISNSGKDEKGSYHVGAAGDQTGHEWELKTWYSRPWTVVLRWPDQVVALKMAELACAAALNNKIGYDQYQRTTYWTQLQKAGYDPAKITTACEEDCTAGVTANCKAAGYLLGVKALQDLPVSVYSGNMRSIFVKAGFKALTASKYLSSPKYLLPGDVLLYEGHHAAMNVTYGAKVRPADATSGSVTVEGLRKGSKGDAVKSMQQLLLKWSPTCLPKYGADGDFGTETEKAVKAFQKEARLAVTGIYDTDTKNALISRTNSIALGADKPSSYAELDGDPSPTPQLSQDGHIPQWVEITGNSVNVRSAPSLNSKVLGIAHNGDRLKYQGVTSPDTGRTWLLVKYDGQNAWVSDRYAELTDQNEVSVHNAEVKD